MFLHGHIVEYMKVLEKGKQHGYGRYWNQNGEEKFLDFRGMMLDKDGSLHINAKIKISLVIFNY